MFTSEKERLKARYNAGREANHILSANHTPSNSAGAEAELPPPAYDSHYSSPSVSASSSAQPPPDARLPAPLALPEKPNRSATLNSVSDTYSHSTTPVTPAGTIVPFPHSSFSNPSVVLQPTATDLNRSGSFASSSFTHTSYSDPSVASHSGATDLNRASSFATSRGTNEFTTSSAASIAPTSSGSGLKSGQVTPPPSFLRTPPRDLTYPSFPSTVLFTADNDLKKGFPREPPQSIVNPHPFATHDICEQDWLWFLSAVKGVAATGGIDFTSLPIVAPTAAHLAVSFGLGRLVNMGIEAHVKSKRRGPLAQVFDTWNQHFFHPRQVDVVLARGRFCYSGPHQGLPPDMMPHRQGSHEKGVVHSRGGNVSDDDFSSDDSHPERSGKRRERRADRRKRRAERSDRREQRMDFLDATENKWRVVVSYKPAVLI